MVQILSGDDFNEFIKDGLVLIDFFAEWCGPCRMLTPILEEISEELGGIVKIAKVNIDDENAIASRYSISSIPTVILLKNGEEVERTVGLKDKPHFLTLIRKHAS